eukprot:gene7563-8849_t
MLIFMYSSILHNLLMDLIEDKRQPSQRKNANVFKVVLRAAFVDLPDQMMAQKKMFRCSSSSLLMGHNVTFTVNYNTQPGENLYIIGSHPHIGEWDHSKAKRMTWNIGNIWDVKIGFPQECYVQYKYFVMNEHQKTNRWEDIENRQIMVDEDEMACEDRWGVRRTLASAIDQSEPLQSIISESPTHPFLRASPLES